MRAHILLPTFAALALCCGCQTTGDPNEGGLFGWSEAKAQQRIAEKQDVLSGEQQRMHSEQASEAKLRGTEQAGANDLAAQQKELGELLANAEALEQEAPTPSDASRARRLRRDIEHTRGNTQLPANYRWSLLRGYAAQVNELRSDWAASSASQPPR